MNPNNPERLHYSQESDNRSDRRSSTSSTGFNVLKDATGSASTIPEKGPLRSVKTFFSDFFHKSRGEGYDLIVETKQEILSRQIEDDVSTLWSSLSKQDQDILFDSNLKPHDEKLKSVDEKLKSLCDKPINNLLALRKSGSNIHREDIFEALSTFIETEFKNLQAQGLEDEVEKHITDIPTMLRIEATRGLKKTDRGKRYMNTYSKGKTEIVGKKNYGDDVRNDSLRNTMSKAIALYGMKQLSPNKTEQDASSS